MGIVGGDQRDAVDLVGEHFDLARVDIEPLHGSGTGIVRALAFETADVGDDDPASASMLLPLGAPPALPTRLSVPSGSASAAAEAWSDIQTRPSRGDDDILGSLDADADLAELVLADWSERHGADLSTK